MSHNSVKPNTAVFGTTQIARIGFDRKANLYIGGNGVVTALEIAKQHPVYLVSSVGIDIDLQYLRSKLPSTINLDQLKILPGKSFYLDTEYNSDTQQYVYKTVDFNSYINYKPTIDRKIGGLINNIHLAGTDPDKSLSLLGQLQKKNLKLITASSLMYYLINKFDSCRELFQNCDVIFFSEEEYEYFNSKSQNSLFDVSNTLELIVVTLGEKGLFYLTSDKRRFLPTNERVKVINPSNAGDVLAGYVFAALVDGKLKSVVSDKKRSLEQILSIAQKTAALAISSNNYYRIPYETN